MRILVASVNHEHPNPMHIAYYQSLTQAADVTFYGPGFSSDEDLRKGIQSFFSATGGYDIVILAFPLLLMSPSFFSMRDIYHWHRYMMGEYPIYDAVRYADSILEQVGKMDVKKALLYGQDFWNIKASWEKIIRDVLDKGFYFLTCGEDFCEDVGANCQQIFSGKRISNLFLNILRDYRSKVISVPFISTNDREVFWGSLKDREYDWVIPGNISHIDYPDRSRVLNRVRQAGYRVFDKYFHRTLVYGSGKDKSDSYDYDREELKFIDAHLNAECPYIRRKIKREALEQWRENYRCSIRKSKMGYADGGNVNGIVGKFLTIPAAGTVLMCEDVVGLKSYGFEDGVNMVLVTPENVVEKSMELLSDEERMQTIADNGRRLVASRHTSMKRAMDTIKAFDAILADDFKGSYWDKGEFHIIRRKV